MAEEDLSKVHQKFIDMMNAEGVFFSRGFLRFIAAVQESITPAMLKEWTVGKDLRGFLDFIRGHLEDFADQVPKTFYRAAKAEVNRLSQEGLFGIGKTKVSFSPENPSAARAVAREQFSLIKDITETQRKAIKLAVEDSIKRGAGAIDAAKTFRNAIGLTDGQMKAVLNYRSALERASADALTRELRDKRFDRTVSRAIQGGDSLSKAQIDKMVLRYTENMRRYRSENISRTETMRILNAAKQESFKQIADKLKIKHSDVERTWVATLDSRTRDTHAHMNRQEVKGLDTPFISPSGEELMFPGDPLASGAETINCRCTMTVKFPYSKMKAAKGDDQ